MDNHHRRQSRCRCKLIGCCTLLAGVLIGASEFLKTAYDTNNGPLGVWWDVAMCRNDSAAFTRDGVLYHVFVARPVLSGQLPGTSCPLEPAEPPPFSLATYHDVGFRRWPDRAEYAPIILLPKGASAVMTLEVTNVQGKSLASPLTIELGTADAPPWAINSSEALERTDAPMGLPPSPPPLPCLGAAEAVCADGCDLAADGVCDDGGSGATYALCALHDDCSDCGMRSIRSCTGARSAGRGSRQRSTGDSSPARVLDSWSLASRWR